MRRRVGHCECGNMGLLQSNSSFRCPRCKALEAMMHNKQIAKRAGKFIIKNDGFIGLAGLRSSEWRQLDQACDKFLHSRGLRTGYVRFNYGGGIRL